MITGMLMFSVFINFFGCVGLTINGKKILKLEEENQSLRKEILEMKYKKGNV